MLDMRQAVLELIHDARCGLNLECGYQLCGDLEQMATQKRILTEAGLKVGQAGFYPALWSAKDFSDAMEIIWQQKPIGWPAYREEYLDAGVCTQAAYDSALALENELKPAKILIAARVFPGMVVVTPSISAHPHPACGWIMTYEDDVTDFVRSPEAIMVWTKPELGSDFCKWFEFDVEPSGPYPWGLLVDLGCYMHDFRIAVIDVAPNYPKISIVSLVKD